MSKPVVVITGASQGIGAAMAREFGSRLKGVRLALVARNERNLARVAAAAVKRGAKAEIFPCDVSDDAAVAEMAAAVTKRFGGVDVLINNAGTFTAAPFAETTVAAFDAMIGATLRSAFLVTRALLPGMLARASGDVFFMSSVAGLQAFPGDAAYCAAKFGVTGLAKVLRMETKERGVRVCCVYPGATWSPSWAGSGIDEERMMPAADVARAFFEVYQMTRRTVVEEIVLRPQRGDL
ncbi:SDR family oxidoreductase [Horticoccus luteus]|uniref:SDR family oxidoreductase n=1 Tax=Horticoccus luteus TaxID=2862869 RepID=A0A8F9TSH5_9BACT|nr:SDR family oxidoreductase [Horticoccus luteus]QYM78225.1 SDR family oxidoreductase [Horticoccus luteus]